MSRDGICADGHAEAAVCTDGRKEGLLSALEIPRQCAISEPGPILLVNDPGDDARPDCRVQVPTAQLPRRYRPYGIELEIDNLACGDAVGGGRTPPALRVVPAGCTCLRALADDPVLVFLRCPCLR